MRVAVYERVSTLAQVEKGYSLDSQETLLREYAERQGWQIVGEYVDGGISGRKDRGQRPELDRLLRDIEAGAVDVVLVYKLDRFSRRPRDLFLMLDIFDRCKVGIVSTTEGVDSRTSNGRLMLGIFVSLAEKFWSDLLERTRDGRIAKMRQGKVQPAPRQLYGYSYDKETQSYVIDAAEASVVKQVFDLYISGKQPRQIAAMLNEAGVPTKQGSDLGWSFARVSEMIPHTEYIGEGWANRHQRHEDGGGRQHRGLRPQEEWVRIDYPAILDRETWFRAQAQRQLNKGERSRNRMRPEYLLGGLLYCGECGHLFAATSSTHRGKLFRYYRCGGRLRYPGRYNCIPRNLKAEVIERVVAERVAEVVSDPDYFLSLLKAQAEDSEAADRARLALDKALEHLQELVLERQRVATGYTKGILTEQDAELQMSRVTEQSEHWSQLAETYKRQIEQSTDWQAVEQSVRMLAVRFGGEEHEVQLPAGHTAEDDVPLIRRMEREAIRAVVSRVTVHRDDSVEVELRVGLENQSVPSLPSRSTAQRR